MTHHLPDLMDIHHLASKTLAELPKLFLPYTENLLIIIENFADSETINSLSIKNKFDLLGLYQGTPLPYKEAALTSLLPDVIFLYRCPIIQYASEKGEKIEKVVNHVMIHEIAHHFGFNDFDIEWIEHKRS